MTDIKLSIVFLNFNRLSETQFTATRLLQQCANHPEFEIIAVDNGSSDGTAEYLKQQKPIKSILLDNNSGIAGYRKGFESATGEYILVLDDDSCPKDLAQIEQALQRMENNDQLGITACHIESPDGTAQWSWHLPVQRKLTPSPFFIGCGFIIRRALFEQIGWYPDAFFLYQNEVAVGFNVRLAGYEILYDPDCIIVHRGIPNQRPGWRRVFYPTRNTLWLIRQYYPQPLASYMLCSRIAIGFLRACTFGELKCYVRALHEGLASPVNKTPLPKSLRDYFLPFFKQNSFFHQLIRRT